TREMIERVFVHVDPEIEALGFNEMRMTVEITLRDGRRLFGRADMAQGHPKKPMSHEDVKAKFRDCADTVLQPPQTEALLDQLEDIEGLSDISALVPLLAGPLE